MGGKCDFGSGVRDQSEQRRVGGVSGVREVVAAEVRREKISTQRTQRSTEFTEEKERGPGFCRGLFLFGG